MALTDVLFPICDIVFDFWPLILLSSVVRSRKGFLRVAVAIWAFLAVMRVFLLFNPNPLGKSLLIGEPLSTYLFVATGAALLIMLAGRTLWQHRRFHEKAGGIRIVEDLQQISASEFEEMVAELYRALGHSAKRTGATGDHGVDVVVRASNGEKWIAQCKRWRTPVGEPVVRDFYGVVQHEKAAQGAIVAAAGFTPEARQWARGKPIFLYDGKEFLKAWKDAKSQAVPESTSAMEPVSAEAQTFTERDSAKAAPLCPACGVPMILRTAGRGAHIGEKFYGCPNYPRCREIARIP